ADTRSRSLQLYQQRPGHFGERDTSRDRIKSGPCNLLFRQTRAVFMGPGTRD
ncbi:unnamed protein product, partial [Ilex paraguariensis]